MLRGATGRAILGDCRGFQRRQPLSSLTSRSPLLVTSQEVTSALSNPVTASRLVALESTIITHGLPYPLNLETARSCEEAIRSAGGVPATIALFDGRAHVGLSDKELQRLAEPPSEGQPKPIKASRRDLAAVLADPKAVGGTTVSGTMLLSSLLGLRIFATGGIGGVHRGGHVSLDVSADLTELGRTNVSVFCSGAKSILDIPRTLEFLETQGVDVLSFDPQGAFPAFYTRDSGCKVRGLREGEREAARVIHASHRLGLGSGRVFGVPIPASYEAAGSSIQAAVEQAVKESVEQGIDKRGKEVTPWLLMRVGQLAPKAGESNRALVVNNAATAARTAVELSKLVEQEDRDGKSYAGASVGSVSGQGMESQERFVDTELGDDPVLHSHASQSSGDRPFPRKQASERPAPIVVFGTAAADITSRASVDRAGAAQGQATTYPGRVWLAPGGVGRNIAEAAASMSRGLGGEKGEVRLVAPTGEDALGAWLRSSCEEVGLQLADLRETSKSLPPSSSGRAATATASLSLDAAGDLITGVVDMSITESVLSPRVVKEQIQAAVSESSIVAFDANLAPHSIQALLSSSTRDGPLVVFEPTSLAKSARILDALAIHLGFDGAGGSKDEGLETARRLHSSFPRILCTPNELEVRHMALHACRQGLDGLLLGGQGKMEARDVEASLLSASQTWGYKIDVEMMRDAVFLTRLLGPQMIKLGSRGVLSCLVLPKGSATKATPSLDIDVSAEKIVRITHHSVPAPLSAHEIVSTTGAGDTFVGALLACLSRVGRSRARAMLGLDQGGLQGVEEEGALHKILEVAQLASARTLRSEWAVAPSLDELGDVIRRDGIL